MLAMIFSPFSGWRYIGPIGHRFIEPVKIISAPNGNMIKAAPPVSSALTIMTEPTTTLPHLPYGEDMNSKTLFVDFVIFIRLIIPPGV